MSHKSTTMSDATVAAESASEVSPSPVAVPPETHSGVGCGCLQTSSSDSEATPSGYFTIRGSKIGYETPKIDLHCHILPKEIPDFKSEFGYGGFITLKHEPDNPGWAQMWKDSTFFRKIDAKCWSIEERLPDMDESNVSVQLISTVPVMFSYWARPSHGLRVARFINDDISDKVRNHPDRLLGLGTLPLQDIELSVAELERCMKPMDEGGLGLVGIEIGSHVESWNLDDDRFYPLWKRAEELGCCVFVHPWDMMGQPLMKKYWLPWLVGMPAETCRGICSLMFGGVFKRYPRLRFCFAHGGGSFAHTIGRIQHGYDCRPDLIQIHLKGDEESPMLRWKRHFWVDSLVHDEHALDYLIKVMSEHKVCLGTDYPFPLGECYPLKKCGQLIETHPSLTKEQKIQMLWENGLDFVFGQEKKGQRAEFERRVRESVKSGWTDGKPEEQATEEEKE